MKYIVKNKKLYYFLQFTWGLLMNTVGALVFAVLIIFARKKPKKFGNCWYIVIGKSWGGVELGTFFLTDSHESLSTKYHEAGHGLQNIIWGPLFPFVIGIPSALRYQYRKIMRKVDYEKYRQLPSYDSIWFEGQATEWGYKYYQPDIEEKVGELFDGK